MKNSKTLISIVPLLDKSYPFPNNNVGYQSLLEISIP